MANLFNLYELNGDEHKSLTEEEMVVLVEKIHVARDAILHLKNKEMSVEDYQQTEKDSLEARDKLIKSHMRFVIKLVKHYRPYDSFHSTEDLIHEGFIGLMSAIERFERKHGKFTTYAGYFIAQKIICATQNDKLISFPPNCYAYVKQAKKIIEECGNSGEYITPDVLAREMKISIKRARSVLKIVTMLDCDPLKLDAPQDSNKNNFESWSATLADSSDTPGRQIEDKEDKKWAFEELKVLLTPREWNILHMYYVRNMTLYDIGEDSEIKLTRERVRQIKRDAILKIREKIDIDKFSIA